MTNVDCKQQAFRHSYIVIRARAATVIQKNRHSKHLSSSAPADHHQPDLWSSTTPVPGLQRRAPRRIRGHPGQQHPTIAADGLGRPDLPGAHAPSGVSSRPSSPGAPGLLLHHGRQTALSSRRWPGRHPQSATTSPDPAPLQAIKAEDRLFRGAMERIGLGAAPLRWPPRWRRPGPVAVTATRPSSALHPRRHRRRHCLQPRRIRHHLQERAGAVARPTMLVDQSRCLGWKGVRDGGGRATKGQLHHHLARSKPLDPMGVHRATRSPSRPRADADRQGNTRSCATPAHRGAARIDVDTLAGQRAVLPINPQDGRMIVIEMNPRVSRSSRFASKATGFPIAKVAAETRRRLHARRAEERDHRRRHAASFGTKHWLRRHQSAAPPSRNSRS